jgi:hypothetical protein
MRKHRADGGSRRGSVQRPPPPLCFGYVPPLPKTAAVPEILSYAPNRRRNHPRPDPDSTLSRDIPVGWCVSSRVAPSACVRHRSRSSRNSPSRAFNSSIRSAKSSFLARSNSSCARVSASCVACPRSSGASFLTPSGLTSPNSRCSSDTSTKRSPDSVFSYERRPAVIARWIVERLFPVSSAARCSPSFAMPRSVAPSFIDTISQRRMTSR